MYTFSKTQDSPLIFAAHRGVEFRLSLRMVIDRENLTMDALYEEFGDDLTEEEAEIITAEFETWITTLNLNAPVSTVH